MKIEPDDEFMRRLQKIIEEIVKNLPDSDQAHIVGCTIITRDLPHGTKVGHPGGRPPSAPPFELNESDHWIFITVPIPGSLQTAPYAEISHHSVGVHLGAELITIDLPHTIDVIHSHYQVKHGVMDIILKKIDTPA